LKTVRCTPIEFAILKVRAEKNEKALKSAIRCGGEEGPASEQSHSFLFQREAMAKTKKSTVKKGAPQAVSPATSKKEMQKVRDEVRNVIVGRSVELAARVVQSVTESGQVAALKYLWEISGLFPADGEGENEEQDSLAQILIERLGLQEEPPRGGATGEGDVESEEALQKAEVGLQK
jgi:hypothetical protein